MIPPPGILREAFGWAAIGITFYAFFPFIRAIRRGETKPHVFSWIIWGITTLIAFFAQLAGGGGFGAWPIGMSGVITMYIALLAYLRSADTQITRSDWCFLIGALSALPFWFLTADPLYAVITLTVVDLLGFGPTLRHAYTAPDQESAGFYALFTLRNGLAVLALEHFSLTTVLFPAAVGFGCLIVSALVIWRRRRSA